MSVADQRSQNPPTLEAKSPFEMRVNLGKDVPETDVRTALATGDTWRLDPEATFLAAQGMVSYYVDTGRPRLAGVEPLLRVSWADADGDQADDAAVVLTPGLMLYFVGKNGLAGNLDFYSPEGGQDAEWSFKVQSFIYF